MDIALFLLLAALTVGGVVGFLVTRNQAHGALLLVLSFASLGGVFGLLGAPFVAAVQVIIYAGAILVLFLFVLMMVNLREGVPAERKKWTIVVAAALGLVLLAELALAIGRLAGGAPPAAGGGSSTAGLGTLLFTRYLYPFEITSLLILAALAGGLTLARKKDTP
jgi:NADH-quinone oxidoreductase subunit J